jgi:predicted small integral membrane protein
MAWTWQTGLFFVLVTLALVAMTILALRRPDPERVGVLAIATTRGDRLFLSLLCAAFIHLIWLGLFGGDFLYGASAVALLAAAAVFRWV